MPGEQLIEKLWDTLTEKAIGNLLKPWQIRRVGKALLDVKREETLVLAQAEREAAAIRAGEVSLKTDAREMVLLRAQASNETCLPSVRIEPRMSGTDIDHATILRAAHADTLRREVNVARAVIHAEAALQADDSAVPKESPADDWLFRWRDYASAVSTEELQSLWGKVLAGEIKEPGVYSPRFLNFLNNLTKDEAQTIASCMPFVIDEFICSEHKEHLDKAGLTLTKLMLLQELGVLNGVEGFGLSQSYSPKAEMPLALLLRCGRHGLGIKGKPGSSLKLKSYVVTNIGKQLARLGAFEADLPYLRAVGATIRELGFEVELGVPFRQASGRFSLGDAERF